MNGQISQQDKHQTAQLKEEQTAENFGIFNQKNGSDSDKQREYAEQYVVSGVKYIGT